MGAVRSPLGGLPGGEGAGKRIVERIQDRVQAARSILQFSAWSGAGDRGCGLADGWRCFQAALLVAVGVETAGLATTMSPLATMARISTRVIRSDQLLDLGRVEGDSSLHRCRGEYDCTEPRRLQTQRILALVDQRRSVQVEIADGARIGAKMIRWPVMARDVVS